MLRSNQKNIHNSSKQQINDTAVKRYFDSENVGTATSISMMAHEYNLPHKAIQFRIEKEKLAIDDWLDDTNASGKILDVGCGAGTWTEVFAKRFKTVIGIEQSSLMIEAAKQKVAYLTNVTLLQADGRQYIPEGPFDMIFLGGLCMYMNDCDVVELLHTLKSRLVKKGGSIILRESTVPQGESISHGKYQAVYRNVDLYRQLFNSAGSFNVEVRRNYGYTNLVTAEELVTMRRKWLPFLPKKSSSLGNLTWNLLRTTTPISFWALPRVLSKFNIAWPKLQNHFFRLRLKK